jgi:hypothetical protein
VFAGQFHHAESEVNKVAEILRGATSPRFFAGYRGDESRRNRTQVTRKPPAVKQFVILVSDPDGVAEARAVGWVLRIPDTESVAPRWIGFHSSYDFNTTKKGRLLPVKISAGDRTFRQGVQGRCLGEDENSGAQLRTDNEFEGNAAQTLLGPRASRPHSPGSHQSRD